MIDLANKTNKKKIRIISYVITIIISLLFIVIGNKIATENLPKFGNEQESKPVKAKVLEIIEKHIETYGSDSDLMETTIISFKAKVSSGSSKGETVVVEQTINSNFMAGVKEVQKGDSVLVSFSSALKGEPSWVFWDYLRTDALIILGVLFCVFLLIFGRMKGFNTILSLVITCAAVFVVLIPSILSGHNIYISTFIVCTFIIASTLSIVYGLDKKSFVALIGCLCGVLISAVLVIIMGSVLSLTGVVDENSIFLQNINTNKPLDLNAIIFSGILIGALGAVMDIAISISSALLEVHNQMEKPSFSLLVSSGFSIGRDIMGTMSNTLILAYVGSSLSVVLLLAAYDNSILGLMNREMIIVEILQALIGSMGLLFTIPLTTLAGSFLYVNKFNIKAFLEIE